MKDNDLTLNWKLINNHLNSISSEIFDGHDKRVLTSLQKRYMIFNYLVNNYEFDWTSYNYKCYFNKKILPHDSMYRLITERKGLCSSLTPFYKFLLERENIPSICCYCNLDDLENQHMILLVKDENNWSFDDVSGAIIGEDPIENLFGYDLLEASKLKTPQRGLMAVSSKMIDNIYFKPIGVYNHEKIEEGVLVILPDNIKKIKISEKNLIVNSSYKK